MSITWPPALSALCSSCWPETHETRVLHVTRTKHCWRLGEDQLSCTDVTDGDQMTEIYRNELSVKQLKYSYASFSTVHVPDHLRSWRELDSSLPSHKQLFWILTLEQQRAQDWPDLNYAAAAPKYLLSPDASCLPSRWAVIEAGKN